MPLKQAKPPPKPKPDEILEQATAMIEAAKDRDVLYRDLEKLYDEQSVEQSADSTAVMVKMSTGTTTVDLVTDLAAQMQLAIEVPASKETQGAKQDAEDVEAWLQAWLRQNERAQNGRNLTADAAWHGTMRSAVAMRTLYIESVANRLPVHLDVRDPAVIYTESGPVGIETVVEAYPRTAGEIRRKYPSVLLPNANDGDTVRWLEYWTDTYRCYFADDEPVKLKGLGAVVPHGLGCLPYAFGMARTTPRSDAAKHVRPLLASSMTLLHNLNVWWSIMLTNGLDVVTNAWAVYSDSYGPNSQRKLNLGNDAVNYFAPGEKVEALQRAGLPGDFFQLGQMLQAEYQRNTFPFAVYGQMPGNLAGYAISLLQNSGKRPLLPIWQAIEQAYEGAFRNCLTICHEKVAPLTGEKRVPLLITEAGEARRVQRELALDTTKFGPDFDVFVSLSDPLPQDEASNLRMAMEAFTSGLLTHETALTKYNIVPDATHEITRKAVEAVFNQLAPIEAIKLAVARGYAPREVTLPVGWQMVNGKLVPSALAPQPEPAPQGPPPGLPGLDQANLQRIASQPQMPEISQMAGEPPLLAEPTL
jgi:hypothetical protein